jgi:hypothetical protein
MDNPRATPYSFLDIATELEARKQMPGGEYYKNFSVPDFAQYLSGYEHKDQPDAFNAGNVSGLQRLTAPFAAYSDLAMQATGLPAATGQLGKGFGSMIESTGLPGTTNMGNVGEKFGESLPTMGKQMLEYSAAPPLGLADIFATTHGETGSLPAAAVQTASFGLFPESGKLGQEIASRSLIKAGFDTAPTFIKRAAEEVGRFAGFGTNQKLAGILGGISTRAPGQTMGDVAMEQFSPDALKMDALNAALMFAHPGTLKGLSEGPRAEGKNFSSYTDMMVAMDKYNAFKRDLTTARAKATLDDSDHVIPSEAGKAASIDKPNLDINGELVSGERPTVVRTENMSPAAVDLLSNKAVRPEEPATKEMVGLAIEHGMPVDLNTPLKVGDVVAHLKQMSERIMQEKFTLLGQPVVSGPKANTFEENKQEVHKPLTVTDTADDYIRRWKAFADLSKPVIETIQQKLGYSNDQIREKLGLDAGANMPLNDNNLRQLYREFAERGWTKFEEQTDRVNERLKFLTDKFEQVLTKQKTQQTRLSVDEKRQQFFSAIENSPEWLKEYNKISRLGAQEIRDPGLLHDAIDNAAHNVTFKNGQPDLSPANFEQFKRSIRSAKNEEKRRQDANIVTNRTDEFGNKVRVESFDQKLEETQEKPSESLYQHQSEFERKPGVGSTLETREIPKATASPEAETIKNIANDEEFLYWVKNNKATNSGFTKYHERLKAAVEYLLSDKSQLAKDVYLEEAHYKEGTDWNKSKIGKNIESIQNDIAEYLKMKGVEKPSVIGSDSIDEVGDVRASTMQIEVPKIEQESKEGVVGTESQKPNEPQKGVTYAFIKKFVDHTAGMQGYSPAFREMFSNVALRVGYLFKKIPETPVIAMEGRDLGLHVPEGNRIGEVKLDHSVIGLNEKGFFNEPEMNWFEKVMTVGHEFMHEVGRFVTSKLELANPETLGSTDRKFIENYKSAFETLHNMSVEDRRNLLSTMLQTLIPSKYLMTAKGEYSEQWVKHLNYLSADPQETLSGISQFCSAGLASRGMGQATVAGVKDFMLFSDKHLTDFQRGYFRNLCDMTETMTALAKQIEIATGSALTSDKASKGMETVLKAMREMSKTSKQVEASVKAMAQLVSLQDPNYFFSQVATQGLGTRFKQSDVNPVGPTTLPVSASMMDAVDVAFKAMGLRKDPKDIALIKNRPSFMDHLWALQQYAELNPVAKPAIDLLFNIRDLTSQYTNKTMSALLVTRNKNGQMYVDPNSAFIRCFADPKMGKAYSDLARAGNVDPSKPLDESAAKDIVSKHISDPVKAENVLLAYKQALSVFEQNRNVMIKGYHNESGKDVSEILMSTLRNLSWTDAKQLGQNIFDLSLVGRENTPEAYNATRQKLDIYNSLKLSPAQVSRLDSFLKETGDSLIKLTQHLSTQVGYHTERRTGEFFVRAKINDKPFFAGYETSAEAQKRVQELLQEQGINPDSISIIPKGELSDFHGIDPHTLCMISEWQNKRYQQMLQTLPSESRAYIESRYAPDSALQQEIANVSMGGAMAKRKFVAGREEQNMLQSALDYFTGVPRSIANKEVRGDLSLMLKDPSLAGRKDVQELVEKNMELLRGGTTEFGKINQAVGMYHLAATTATAGVDQMMLFSQLSPLLTRRGATVADSLKMTLKAANDVAGMYISNTFKTGKEFSDPVEQAAWKDAVSKNIFGPGVYDEMNWQQDVLPTQIKRLANATAQGVTPAGLAKNKVMWAVKMSVLFRGQFDSLGSQVAYMASFRNAIKQGMTYGNALIEARQGSRLATGLGGKTARPTIVKELTKIPGVGGVVGAAYTLQGYTMCAFQNLLRGGIEALGKTGLQGAELTNARKSFAQSVITLGVMSGALGAIPGLGAMLYGMEKTTGIQANAAVREFVASFAGDDEELGGLMADTAMHGLLSTASGYDVSGRLGVGQLLGIDPQGGMTIESATGAAGGLMKNLVMGAQDIASGEVGKAVRDITPSHLKPLVDLYKNDGKFVDAKGNLIMNPTATQQVMYGLGLRPMELTRLREHQNMDQLAQKVAGKNLQQFYRQMADKLVQGDGDFVRQSLLQRENDDQSFNAEAGAHAIAQLAEQRVVPIDVMQNTSKADMQGRAEIAKVMASGRPRVSQEQRLALQNEFANMMGIKLNPHLMGVKMQKSTQVDSILEQYPWMSVGEANALLDSMAMKRRQTGL